MKIVKILNCKNSLILGLLFVVTLFPILMIMQNANGELSIIKNKNNLSEFENLNKTTITTSNATLENNIDNKTILIQEDISLAKALDILKIHPSETVTIGDSETDIPLFKFCGFSIALNHSDKIVKSQANHVVSGNEGKGLVEALDYIAINFFGKTAIT